MRCAAALVFIGGVAVFGMKSDLSGDAAPAERHARTVLNASLAYSQELYKERNQQFGSSHVASGVIVSAAHAKQPPVDAWERRDE
jgi:hypothetical protein